MHNCPACGTQHRTGWLHPHTCGHNGCEHECPITDESVWVDDTPYDPFNPPPLPSGDNPLYA